MPLIDFKRLRQTLPLQSALRALGWPLYEVKASRARGNCPCGCIGDNRCCSFDFAGGMWKCHRCGHWGDFVAFLREVYHSQWQQQLETVCQHLGFQLPLKEEPPRRRRDSREEVDDDVDGLTLGPLG